MEDSRLLLAQLDIPHQVEPVIMAGPAKDHEAYLAAIMKLQGAINFFQNHSELNTCEGMLRHATALMETSMQKGEEDFNDILGSSSCPVDPSELMDQLSISSEASSPVGQLGSRGGDAGPPSSRASLELLSPEAFEPLAHMAAAMEVAGYGEQCLKVYSKRRSAALNKNIDLLGVERSLDIHALSWVDLEGKIRTWIAQFSVVVRTLIAGEKDLCAKILTSLEDQWDTCLAEVAGGSMQQLIAFGSQVAESRRAAEKLFALLDMFETVWKVKDEVDALFAGPPGSHIRKGVANLLKALSLAARETLDSWEVQIETSGTLEEGPPTPAAEEPSPTSADLSTGKVYRFLQRFSYASRSTEETSPRTPPPRNVPLDGGVLPLTSYVVNYVKLMSSSELSYLATLKQVFGEAQIPGGTLRSSKLVATAAKIMLALTKNLQVKARYYRDPALSELFLMNNYSYIYRGMSSSDAGQLLGMAWLNRQRGLVKHHMDSYVSHVSAKLEDVLADSTQMIANRYDVGQLSKRFKAFQTVLEELHQKQLGWCIPESGKEQREKIRAALVQELIPRYRTFYEPYKDMRVVLPRVRVYSPEEVQHALEDGLEDPRRAVSSSSAGVSSGGGGGSGKWSKGRA